MSAIASAPSGQRRERPAPRVQLYVAHAVLLTIAALAAILRFSALNALPLSPEEAERALGVWRFWQPADLPGLSAPVSPAYFSLTALLMPILGDGDVVVRLIPALFGVLLVPVPWLWRNRLGTLGALTASLLLATSPVVNMTSQTAGGDSIALLATLLLLVGWMRYHESGERRWLMMTLAALALGLASSSLFYGGLATLSVAWLVQVRLGPLLEMPSGDGRGLSWQALRPLIAVGTGIFLALSTMFLWHPSGLGAAATQVVQWLGRFTIRGDLETVLSPFLALGRYELMAATLGLAAIVWASWRGLPLPLFLVYWFTAGTGLLLIQQGNMANVVFLIIPAYLLISLWVDRTFQERTSLLAWLLLTVVLVLSTVAYVNGARYLRLMTFDPTQITFLLLAFVAIASTAVAVNFVRSINARAALQGTLAGIMLLFLTFGWGTARWMAQEGGNDPRERWVTTGTDDDVLLLAEVLREISWQATGKSRDLEVVAGVENPVLRWYLREFDKLQIGRTIPAGTDAAAMITPAETDLQPGEDYFGADFALLQTGATLPEVSNNGLGQSLRWWLFHEHPAIIEKQRVLLWVRNDGLEQ